MRSGSRHHRRIEQRGCLACIPLHEVGCPAQTHGSRYTAPKRRGRLYVFGPDDRTPAPPFWRQTPDEVSASAKRQGHGDQPLKGIHLRHRRSTPALRIRARPSGASISNGRFRGSATDASVSPLLLPVRYSALMVGIDGLQARCGAGGFCVLVKARLVTLAPRSVKAPSHLNAIFTAATCSSCNPLQRHPFVEGGIGDRRVRPQSERRVRSLRQDQVHIRLCPSAGPQCETGGLRCAVFRHRRKQRSRPDDTIRIELVPLVSQLVSRLPHSLRSGRELVGTRPRRLRRAPASSRARLGQLPRCERSQPGALGSRQGSGRQT